MNISEQIRNYRKSVGLTQEQVANALGVSASGYERSVFFPGRIDRQGDWTVC